MFSTLTKKETINSVTFNLSSANTFNLVQPKNLLFGKELKAYYVKQGYSFELKVRVTLEYKFKENVA